MKTKHSIYRIVCVANGMVYIGQTINVTQRRKDHFSTLKRNCHTNSRLQNSYNKYGVRSFYFEVIEKNIASDLINKREIYWIRAFNSNIDGFNLTRGGNASTDTFKIPCAWNGIEYESVSEAARALSISSSAMFDRLNKGYAGDTDLIGFNRCVWNGVEYRSITECALANNVTDCTMSGRLRKGYSSDKNLKHPRPFPKVCFWNGIEYPSAKAASRALGVTHQTMLQRIRKGFKSDEDIKYNSTPCTWNGVEYASIKKAALANGIDGSSMSERIKKGYKSDLDFKHRSRTRRLQPNHRSVGGIL